MLSILALGFLIGMQHALEADHVAAVSSLVCRLGAVRRIVEHGWVWGVGHALTLMGVAGGAVWSGVAISHRASAWLEAIVGVMLLALGGQVIWRLYRDRVHFHLHRHEGSRIHLHAHSHKGEAGEAHGFDHRHGHPRGLPLRTFFVGAMHGLSGSAALVVLTASTISEPATGFVYVLMFGAGSILGMVALSALMAVPLSWTARALTGLNRILQAGVGAATCVLGVIVIVQISGWL